MGYEVGAIKYFIGMLTSAWDIITAYLFANGLLHPIDYIQAVVMILSNLNKPEEVLHGILNIVVVSPWNLFDSFWLDSH